MNQRDKMRQLFGRFHGKKESVISAYAAAETAGEVQRKKNGRGISNERYAERLFADGIRKRWI